MRNNLRIKVPISEVITYSTSKGKPLKRRQKEMERLCGTVRLRAGGASGAELEGSADLSTNSQSVQGNISALCSSYNENRLSFGIDLQRPLLLAPLLDPSDQLLERGMAVFMLNICKFNNCGLTFQNLGDLIQHIEDNHIDYDPQVIEEKEHEQPSCLPLSYVLRFFTDAARREVLNIKPKLKSMVEKPVIQPQQTATFNGNEADDDIFSESEDSNDSWSTQEEFSSEFILKYGSKMVSPTTLPDGTIIEKPFACPVPGCKKRYKNVNGIKYHSKNGHKNEGKIRKGFKCYCGKSYKTNGGLKNHTALMHSGTTMTTIATQNGTPQVLQIPTLQPIRTLTLKHIASLGLPVKTLVVATKSQDKTAKTTSSLGVLTPVTSPDSPEKPTEIVLSDN